MNILYYIIFKKIDLSAKDLQPISSTLTKFTKDSNTTIGITNLYMTLGSNCCSKVMNTNFFMVDI